jgi:hypothetical protein
LNIQIKENDKNWKFEDEYTVIAIDSTGIKVTDRGQWMQDKWNVRNNNKKGYLKIYIAVNIKSKKILSIKVTNEHVNDIKALPILVDDVMKSNNITAIGKLFADGGAYDSNDIFRCLMDNRILPCIKVRKNSRVIWKKGRNFFRNLSVLAQRNDLQKWKDRVSYDGQRWIVETVFSCLKRMFGGNVYTLLD